MSKKHKTKVELVPWMSARADNVEKRFIQVGNTLLFNQAFQSLKAGSQILYLCMAMESAGKRRFIFPQAAAKKYKITPEGYLSLHLPVMLPKRSDEDRSRYLAGLLRVAIREKYREQLPPKFGTCVLVYEHIYDLSRNRRFIDHDNMELKHCQDVLEAAFLVNDTAALCSAFQCNHRGEQDRTRIWILTPEQFSEWLENHPECWKGTTEKMQE